MVWVLEFNKFRFKFWFCKEGVIFDYVFDFFDSSFFRGKWELDNICLFCIVRFV